jgi:hypothetical protein
MVLCAALPSQTRPQVPPAACRSDTVERTQQRLDYLKDLVSSRSSERAEMRRTLGVKQASAASVRLVRDPGLCRRAVAALTRLRQGREPPPGIWVYELGRGYAIDEPSQDRLGSDRVLYLFDQTLVHHTGVLAP